MDPIRSALFIPGNKEGWVESAHEHCADVIILDLEDSVPPDEKESARDIVTEHIPKLHSKGQRVHVRINGHPNATDGTVEDDIEAILSQQPEALFVPKVREPADVENLDVVLTHVERREDLPTERTKLIVSIETIEAMPQVGPLCDAASRVETITCGAVKGTDTNYALDFEWTGPGREGLETIHLRQQALMDARAAGVEYPLAGTYVDIEDIEGLRKDMKFSREMGYTGYLLIHPTHVKHANEIFLPDAEEVEYWMGVREALCEAEAEGKSAVQYEGEMIELTNLATAERYLDYAREFKDELNVSLDT